MVSGTTMLLQYTETQVLNVLHGVTDAEGGNPPAYIVQLREFTVRTTHYLFLLAVGLF